ncbi:MAG TPA: DNA-processing protein DprA [Rhizomicrobium sp.]|jgi:DNA processing protein|nr:DNA-processing protein DprA [Rhizomicrobium sp.]
MLQRHTERPLSDRDRLDWLRLARTDRVGPVTFANLIARFGSAGAALVEIPGMARRGGGKNFVLPEEDAIAAEMERLDALGGQLICSCEPDFPRGLGALDPPPPVISILGHRHLLRKEMIAIVGARNASALARKFTDTLARELGLVGLVVVSGLARGIDAAAHEASLAVGTAAVVAGGVDVIYPPENTRLYHAIREQGVIVSEMPPGEAPQARHFPRRNRLISGLSRGVVVVEAAERSGSLITANYALEQGREIFAVPGSPLDPRAKGPNRLIRDGATLTEGVQDILQVLTPMLGCDFGDPDRDFGALPGAASDMEADRIRASVEEALGPAPVEIDELIRQLGAPAGAVLTVILELELAGRCVRLPGNRVSWS